MKKILVLISVLVLASCAEYPYRGNYYGNNRYEPSPYYGGYGYGYGAVYRGGYGGGYRDHDDYRGYRREYEGGERDVYRGYRREYEGGERGGYRSDDH